MRRVVAHLPQLLADLAVPHTFTEHSGGNPPTHCRYCLLLHHSRKRVDFRRVRTAQHSYSNWIDVINLNAEPIQVCTCQVGLEGRCDSKIRAEIEQSGVSLQNAFSIVEVGADSSHSINSLDFGSVAVGGVSLKCAKLVNEGSIPLWMHIDTPAEITPVVILAGNAQLCVGDCKAV